jgi:hypothetical protein
MSLKKEKRRRRQGTADRLSDIRPRFGKILTAMHYSGRGRSILYGWAARYPGLFRKSGFSTLVDFDVLDRILDEMPIVEIKPDTRTHHKRTQRVG